MTVNAHQEPKPFWMVMGGGPTSKMHATREAAENEADRLASAYPGQWFAVMESVAVYRAATTHRFAFDFMDRNGQIPF